MIRNIYFGQQISRKERKISASLFYSGADWTGSCAPLSQTNGAWLDANMYYWQTSIDL